MAEPGRWAGRSAAKDVIRAQVWSRLVAAGAGTGPVHDMIPSLAGADTAGTAA